MDRQARKLWDTQSKASTETTPKAIGQELVTLYKNYCSDIKFCKFILFVGGVSTALQSETKNENVFSISALSPESIIKIKDGLESEARKKTYISDEDIAPHRINDFLNEVIIVVDNKTPEEYVRSIVRINPNLIVDDTTLTAIFNEIRDKQSGKKNIGVVEGITIETCDQALTQYRHLTSTEIRLLVLARLINVNPISKGLSLSFIPIYNQCPPESRTDLLEDCKLAMVRALFNKNNADSFWELFRDICDVVTNNPSFDVDRIWSNLNKNIVDACFEFDVLALKYFIAIVKDGLSI